MNSLLDADKQPVIDNYYNELVGEGKKFQDNEALAKGKYMSDVMIEDMKIKFDQLRADYEKVRTENMSKANYEDLIDQLSKRLTSNDNNNLPVNEAVKKPEIDVNQIKSLVSSEIRENEKQKKETENFNQVESKLKERYGDNSQAFLRQQMTVLGLDQNTLDNLAKTNPQLLIRSLGLDAPASQQGFQAPPRNSPNFSPSTPKERTWAYYQELKKSNPNLYYDPKINRQMIADHQRLGSAFEDGDYNRFG